MPAPAASLGRGRRLILEWALVAMVSTLAIGWLAAAHVTVRADNVVYDLLSRAAVRPPRDDIVIVAIDNRSIQDLGRWPWPRARHAALLDQLGRARPKLVAYDVLFVDPDADPANDQALATAMKAAAAPVILPLTFDVPGDNGAPFRLTLPVTPLRAAAAALAQVNLEFDPDGVVRRAMLAESDGHTVWPHMMESAYRLATGHDSPIYAKGEVGDAKARPDGLLRSRPMLIPFAGPPGHFRTVSFVDVLKGQTPPDFLKGKIVLVGATADGLGDRYSTPLSGGSEVMAGVEVQGNVLDALLSGRAIRPLATPWVAALSLAPLWLLLLGFLRLRPRANMILGLVLMAACIALSAGLLLGAQVWAPPAAALTGLVLVYPLWSWRRLEVTSAYMMQELQRFADEPDVAPSAPRQPLGSDVVAREINLMQGAVGRMRELRRFVSDTLQGLPDATVVIDLEERVLMANRAADVLFETLIGAAPKGLPLWRLLDPFASDFGGADEELTAKGATYQMRRIALHDTLERSVGWIVRFTDISALKAAARQREQVLQLLTHDMRSPQVSILALLDSPGEDKPPPNLARRIEGYARRTLALADDFVHLARAESTVLDLELLDLGDLTTEAVDDLWPQSSARNIAVSVEVGDEEHLVLADRSLISRALINLIGNAVKYTEPGGRVDCKVRLEGGEVVCAISDTGRGMAPEQLERLFERFHRGGAAKSTDGVGLGLAFVQTVVERHGGKIECASVEGEGSTFTLRFAAAPGVS